MKKKIITILVTAFLLIPFVVRADMVKPEIYYNRNTVVGGTVEESIILGLNRDEWKKLDNFTIEYDSKKLSITSKDIEVIDKGKNIIADGNNGSVKVEDGKVIINVTNIPESNPGIDWDLGVDSTQYYIRVKFTAVGAGETTINTSNNSTAFYPTRATVKIAEKDCPVNSSTNCVSSDEGSDTTEAATTSEAKTNEATNETKKEENPPKEEKRDKDLLFYISLGANALLLVLLIIVLIAKKKPKVEAAPVVQETTPAPTEENKE